MPAFEVRLSRKVERAFRAASAKPVVKLRNVARNGGFDQRPSVHVHGVRYSPTIHALDADGVDEVLTKHEATFQRHFENTLRRMNH